MRCYWFLSDSLCSAIDLAPKIIEGMLQPLAAASGWTFSVLGAGPVPEDNGAISSLS